MSMAPSMNDTDTEHGTWQTRTRATRDQPLQHPPRRPQARQPLLPAPPLALGSCFAFVHEHEPPSEPQPVRPAELRPLASASRRRGWRHRVCSRTCGDGRWCTQQRVRRGIAAVGGASGQAKGKGTRIRTLPPDVHEPSRFPHTQPGLQASSPGTSPTDVSAAGTPSRLPSRTQEIGCGSGSRGSLAIEPATGHVHPTASLPPHQRAAPGAAVYSSPHGHHLVTALPGHDLGSAQRRPWCVPAVGACLPPR